MTLTLPFLNRRVVRPDRPHPAASSTAVLEILDQLEARDLWFYDHFIKAPGFVVDFLGRVVDLGSSRVLDFGCGQGLMAKGVARTAREVHGIDIVPDFKGLEQRFTGTFGVRNLYPPVVLKRVRLGAPLPYRSGSFDAAYAWSVFEHVADVPAALRELHRVIRPGGAFFLQISPLYYSAQGGHLWNLVDEPWIHLRLSREELLDRARRADLGDSGDSSRPDILQGRSAAAYRNATIACHDTLNRITVGALVERVEEAGFTIIERLTMQEGPDEVPADLLERYSREDLTIGQVVLLLTR